MNKKIVVSVIVVLLVGVLSYLIAVKKPASNKQSQSNNLQNAQSIIPSVQQKNLQVSKDIIQCGSVNQSILIQYDYQLTEKEKEAVIKSLTCINQAIVKCSPAVLTINDTNKTMNVAVKGQEKLGCSVGVQKYTGEIITCPLPSDYVVAIQKKFTASNFNATIVTDLINNINAEMSGGNKSGNCTVINAKRGE